MLRSIKKFWDDYDFLFFSLKNCIFERKVNLWIE